MKALWLLALLLLSSASAQTVPNEPQPQPASNPWVDNFVNFAQALRSRNSQPRTDGSSSFAGELSSLFSGGNNSIPEIRALLASAPSVIQVLASQRDDQSPLETVERLLNIPAIDAIIPDNVKPLLSVLKDEDVKGAEIIDALESFGLNLTQFNVSESDVEQLADIISLAREAGEFAYDMRAKNATVGTALKDLVKNPKYAELRAGVLEMIEENSGLDTTYLPYISSQCQADMTSLLYDLLDAKYWALLMLDAMGKPSAGILTGQTTFFGDYDECMSIENPVSESHHITGRFCGINIGSLGGSGQAALFLGDTPLAMHVCLPGSCSAYDIFLMTRLVFEADDYSHWPLCVEDKDPAGDDRFLAGMIILSFLALLCAVGTFYGVLVDRRQEKVDKYKKLKDSMDHACVNKGFTDEKQVNGTPLGEKGQVTNGPASEKGERSENEYVTADLANGKPLTDEAGVYGLTIKSTIDEDVSGRPVLPSPPPRAEPLPHKCSQLLLSFSVLRNGRKVLSCRRTQGELSCLHGIRVLSITWVILGHCFSQFMVAQGNKSGTATMLENFTYTVFPGALLAVDTFFLLSGCLTSFLFMRQTKKAGGLTCMTMVMYYVHRYVRLTPLYGIILMFYICISSYLSNGPLDPATGYDRTTSCPDYWYLNILYVNNFFPIEKLCMGVSWFLSNDMQFYVIAPIILVPWAFGKKATGLLLSLALVLCHVIATFVISYTEDLQIYNENSMQYMTDIYFVPWCRVGPYAIGLVLGYVLHRTKCEYKMDKLSVFLGWLLATGVGFTCVYVLYDNTGDLANGPGWNALQAAVYESLGKVSWAFAVSWVIFACCSGYGGFVNTLLSWSAWLPLSRLTYGVYLIHLLVLFIFVNNSRRMIYLDGWTGTQITLSVTVLSYLAAFVFTMLIESPTLGVEKILLGGLTRGRKKPGTSA